jgi:hypothetical protein
MENLVFSKIDYMTTYGSCVLSSFVPKCNHWACMRIAFSLFFSTTSNTSASQCDSKEQRTRSMFLFLAPLRGIYTSFVPPRQLHFPHLTYSTFENQGSMIYGEVCCSKNNVASNNVRIVLSRAFFENERSWLYGRIEKASSLFSHVSGFRRYWGYIIPHLPLFFCFIPHTSRSLLLKIFTLLLMEKCAALKTTWAIRMWELRHRSPLRKFILLSPDAAARKLYWPGCMFLAPVSPKREHHYSCSMLWYQNRSLFPGCAVERRTGLLKKELKVSSPLYHGEWGSIKSASCWRAMYAFLCRLKWYGDAILEMKQVRSRGKKSLGIGSVAT